jgi:hypothetical protein
MPPNKDSEDEARLQEDPTHMPTSKATGDERLLECIISTVAELGVCRSRQGADAMQKWQEIWQEMAVQVQAAAKFRQQQLRDEYVRNLRNWNTKESERQASGGKKRRAEKKPSLHRIKWEVSAEDCKQSFVRTKTEYQALAHRFKLSRRDAMKQPQQPIASKYCSGMKQVCSDAHHSTMLLQQCVA